MLDVRVRHRLLVVLAALVAVPGGVLHAALTTISDAAVANETAVRGTRAQIAEPERPTTTPYGLPVTDGGRAGWSDTHAAYPATDIFLGCGAELVAPVWGTVLEVRRVDAYDPVVDDPANRGGRSVSILGFDGVRYYLAHLDEVAAGLTVGDPVEVGQRLGTIGDTGRTSACHLHFGISPPCPNPEWWVRRGVIWPHGYLDAWRDGRQVGPADEVAAWATVNPNACVEAATDTSTGHP